MKGLHLSWRCLVMVVFLLSSTYCLAADKAGTGQRTATSKQTTVGEIAEHSPFGDFSPGFTGRFKGIQFKLKEHPDKTFRVYADSFDEAAKLGLMTRTASGVFKFDDLTGKKVEVVYQSETGGHLKVTSLKWLEGSK